MTSGAQTGVYPGDDVGRFGHAPLGAYAVAAAGPALFAIINIWSRLHDQPALAAQGRSWEVVVWEVSSAVVTILLLPLIGRVWGVGRLRALSMGWAIALAIGAAIAFFLLHVGGFVLLRHFAYALAGSSYSFGGIAAWAYELPKDLLTFAICWAVLATGTWLDRVRPVADPACAKIAVREGSRTHFIEPGEIFAVGAAGNYIEYHMRDDRRILARGKLAESEEQLARLGIVRTHRSWLVNAHHIIEVRSLGAGECEVGLASGLTVPVARRKVAALRAMLGGVF